MGKIILPEWVDPSTPTITNLGRMQQLRRYEFALNYISDEDTVLDLGCGSGYGTKTFAAKAHRVMGLDKSKEAIDYAKRHHSAPNIDYVVADFDFPVGLDGKADVIVALEVIEHLQNPELFLKNCYDLLVKEGVMILSTPTGNSKLIPKSPYHKKEYSRQELTDILQNTNYAIIELRGQGPILGAVLRYLTQRNILEPGVGVHHQRIKRVTDNMPYFSTVFSTPTSFMIDTSHHLLVAAKK